MKNVLLTLCIAFTFIVFPSAFAAVDKNAAKEKRLALVIGNSNYQDAPLANPVNDARDLASTLRSIGFEVTQKENLDAAQMKRAIREFGDKIRGNQGVALFFYAGHGVQVKGNNYLIPVGHSFKTENDIEDEAVDANTVMRRLEEANNRVNIVVLDACRNNPFARNSRSRSLSRGLARMEPPSGTLVAFATAPGTEASDGDARNGLYTKHLVANIKSAGLTIEQVFKRVREGVERESNNAQSPREESSLKGEDFYFLPPNTAVAQSNSRLDPQLMELTFWESAKSSNAPADYRAYLEQYPSGKFAPLARNQIASLEENARTQKTRASSEQDRPAIAAEKSVATPAIEKPAPVQLAMAAPVLQTASKESKLEQLGTMTYLKVADLRTVRRDGILNIQAEIFNESSRNQSLYYRFKWLDAAGFSVWDEEPWKPVIVYGKQKQLITTVAPTPKATDFRLVLQSPENTTEPRNESGFPSTDY